MVNEFAFKIPDSLKDKVRDGTATFSIEYAAEEGIGVYKTITLFIKKPDEFNFAEYYYDSRKDIFIDWYHNIRKIYDNI